MPHFVGCAQLGMKNSPFSTKKSLQMLFLGNGSILSKLRLPANRILYMGYHFDYHNGIVLLFKAITLKSGNVLEAVQER